ncbi:hypothetical protein HPB50_028859 [Hyalomma asiaticum]|nr:hypothetical protein HPB50_028859 [Hyalomma asiaticum]
MYALVRFVEDKTDKRYVIPVDDITNFAPKHDLDFDNTVPYDAYWFDKDDDDNSGIYAVQILKLAGMSQKTAAAVLVPPAQKTPQVATGCTSQRLTEAPLAPATEQPLQVATVLQHKVSMRPPSASSSKIILWPLLMDV